MSEPPVLFLDVDGVLNTKATYESLKRGEAPLCLHCVARLHRIVAETQCRIVLSSEWRGVPSLERQLSRAGIFHRAHKDRRTPFLPALGRGHEIAQWLSRHQEVKRFAIVDDQEHVLPNQRPFFVKIAAATGLTDQNVTWIARILAAGP